MKKENIHFSSDNGKISRKDLDKTSKMTEEYFEMKRDPSQIPATSENKDWVYKKIPDYFNLIKNNGKIIGYSLLLPCNRDLMEDFVKKKIDETTLFEGIKMIKLDDIPKTIYLCASIVKEDFRRRGLATSAFIKAINKITKNGKEKPSLFCWKYSEEGERLAKRVSKIMGLELKVRE